MAEPLKGSKVHVEESAGELADGGGSREEPAGLSPQARGNAMERHAMRLDGTRDADDRVLPLYFAATDPTQKKKPEARRRRRGRGRQGRRAAEARQARQGAEGGDGRPRRRDRRGPRGERRGVRQELRPARRAVAEALLGAAGGGAGLHRVRGKYQGSSFTELLESTTRISHPEPAARWRRATPRISSSRTARRCSRSSTPTA